MQAKPLRPRLTQSTTRYSFWKYPYPRLGRFNTGLPPSDPSSLRAEVAPTTATEEPKPASPVVMPSTDSIVDTERLRRPTISLPLFVVSGILCLLVGSLLRSLLSEADFVIHLPAGSAVPNGESWRELKRLVEWRIGWNRDLIIAIARRA